MFLSLVYLIDIWDALYIHIYIFLCARQRKIVFCKKKKNTLILPKSSLNLVSSTCSSFDWQLTCSVWWTCFQQNMGTNCSSSRRLVPLFIWGRLHTGASQEKQKKLPQSFNFTFRYIYGVLSLNNCRLGDFVNRMTVRGG